MLPEFDPEDVIKTELIDHAPAATERSVARRIALQVLYELDTTNHKPDDVIAARLAAQESEKRQSRYVRMLVHGVLAHCELLDGIIRQYAVEMPLEQLATVDRNILRMALFELGVERRVPIGVVVDEAVGLAQVFSTESVLSFINGVLANIAADETVLARLRSMISDDGEKVV